MLDQFFGGKAWYKSATGWGIVIFAGGSAVAKALCEVELVSVETCATLTSAVQWIGGIITTLGLRKAATSANVS